MKAVEIFGEMEKSILNIIRAADLYAIHLLASSRKEEPDKQLIQSILAGQISTITVLGMPYTKAERNELKKSGILEGIGNQIVLATYTALEFYLINKFKEYLRFRLTGAQNGVVQKVLDKLWFRSLGDIAKLYKSDLGIHLPCFEIDINFIGASSAFNPKSTWEGIRAVEKARHGIAHEGKAQEYKIGILPDAWEPFEFVRRWIGLFDVNFDRLIYEGRSTRLIKEYQKRIVETASASEARRSH